jgi:hypothetical protein
MKFKGIFTDSNLVLLGVGAVAGAALLSRAKSTADEATFSSVNANTQGCSATAFAGNGNSPGWYTEGANSSGGAGWGGAAGHHHCDWKAPCCYCTDVKKCISSGTPPQTPGSCRPDWGTSGYLGGGSYPATADFSKCPAGTAGSGGGGGTATTGGGAAAAGSTLSGIGSGVTGFLGAHKVLVLVVVGAIILSPVLFKL